MRFSAGEIAELQRRVEDLIEAANDKSLPLSRAQRAHRLNLAIKIRKILNGTPTQDVPKR